ncbi:MAG: SNF2 family DNA or RNA helicase [Candidatus Marinamargulisbacteria bacterium]|jgi:SNF2 family DNA or RNA helicase
MTEKRLEYVIEFVFDQNKKPLLSLDLTWNEEHVSLALSSLLQFLFQNEKKLHKDDQDFCYALAKLIKKVQIGNDFYLGISSEQDIAYFFVRARDLNIPLKWRRGDKQTRVRTSTDLPFAVKIESKGQKLVCRLLNQFEWAQDALGWLVFKHNDLPICFSKGTLFFDISSDLRKFIASIIKTEITSYEKSKRLWFYDQIYKPNKLTVQWLLNTDFSEFVPKETRPVPVLSLDYEDLLLNIKLSFQYGHTVVDALDENDIIIDKKTKKQHKRQTQEEGNFQSDLMTLFEEFDLPFLLNNLGDIAKFMDKVVPILQKRNWTIKRNVPELNIAETPVDLSFGISSSEQDWFYFEPNCQIDNQNFSLQEISRLLVQNHGYLKTKTGYVKLSEKTKEELSLLNTFESFKVGKKFSKTEILPLIASTEIEGSNEESSDLVSLTKNFHKVSHFQVSKDFKADLRDYQQFGVNWINFLFTIGLGGILADDMGLGKTVQTIAFTAQMESPHPVLVIGPTNVIYNWQAEIEQFRPDMNVCLYSGTNRIKQLNETKNPDYIITSYGVIKNDIDILKGIKFRAVVLDEAQQIKNPNTQISKSVKKLNGELRLALTGTPIENHFHDLWNLFDFVMPGYLGTKGQFDMALKEGGKKQLRTKIKPFVLRREKKEVLDSLPAKTEIVLKCPLTETQAKLYKTILDATRKGIQNSAGKRERLHVLTSLLKLRQVCTHPKMITEFQNMEIESPKFELAKSKITSLIEEGHKIVIFTQFTRMIKMFNEWAVEQKYYHEHIDGSVSAKKRMDAINRFQESTDPGFFVISLKAGGVGINLTAADYVLHMDPWWNPAVEAQATDRVHRIGQTQKVIVYKFIAEGTIEEKIQDLQESKRSLLSQIIELDGVEDKDIDFGDIKTLLAQD